MATTKTRKKRFPQKANSSSFVAGGYNPKNPGLGGRKQPNALQDDSGRFSVAELTHVQRLASLDRSEATVANNIGLSVKEFRAALQDNAALTHAFEVGRGLARDFLVDRLRKHGKKFFASDIYAAKALHSLTDRPESNDDDYGQVVIMLPGASGSDQRVIEGQALNLDDPHDNFPVVEVEPTPKMNGASPPPEPERSRNPPLRPQTREEAAAVEALEHKLGIRRDRASFDSEAAWRRYNKQR